MRKILFLCIFILGFSTKVFAEAEPMDDPAIHDRFKAVASELRCLKCQNLTIYDSKAGLADDLRKQIKEQIYAGKTDEQIVDYMVERYGDFVRYKPAMDTKNLLLWIGPFIFLVIGGVMLVRYINIRRKETANADVETISEEDHLRARRILEEGGDK
ncbi:MAG: cytochrome c-type biogenesis protein [Gammaproteobacteria bacterium]|nr:cytochrome c-type biogenesis protein [Gammaproteobacteria bacterium]